MGKKQIGHFRLHITIPFSIFNAIISARNSTFNAFIKSEFAYPSRDFNNGIEFLLADKISIKITLKSGPNFGLNSDKSSNFVSQSGPVFYVFIKTDILLNKSKGTIVYENG